ncbi:MHYT domain-containing protein [Spirilliplanes yamanashiensis]|uniref:Membrane protein n=1 Tax=Spirilliplanes yamanashiensis TaxID=42233 RepID=A0A8J3YDS5_9ACTN|nr:MHYT domain-containing protein [Spirilliplanes yamanashiensis]MDP9816331.1 NO-binding membrane sensor protein with MHYT domain [Spirilliplanes yamanashiensis]GIJ05858.1 membrane protein [Spirilliplanes yamanashiensis]
MAEVHHFTYGAFNPVAAYLLAFLGSLLGLLCTQRARAAQTRHRRTRWLIIAAFAIGGAGIWLMHFTAMLGFDVPDSPVRYDLPLTLFSMGMAVVTVGIGLVFVGHGPRTPWKLLAGGAFTGTGVLAMHYTGMAAMHVGGEIHYDAALVAASAVIAVVASTVALWCTVYVKGWLPILGAAAVMGVAVCGMHYTGMAAMSVEMADEVDMAVDGIRPLLLIVPITLVTAAVLIGVAFSALQAMTEEEFTDGAAVPRRGAHAEPWSLRHASLGAIRRGGRPSPRPAGRAADQHAEPVAPPQDAATRDAVPAGRTAD